MEATETGVRDRAHHKPQGRRPAGQAKTLPVELLVPDDIASAVLDAVCDPRAFDLPRGMITSSSKLGGLPLARSVIAFLLHALWRDPEWTRMPPKPWATLQQIGMVIKRDHTSTHDSIHRLVSRCQADPYLLALVVRAIDLLAELVADRDVDRVISVKERLEGLCAPK